MRRQRAGPLLDSLHAWLNEVQLQVAPKSAIAKAIAYALNRWQALILYLQEGRLSIGRVEMWRGGGRQGLSVSVPFV